MDISNKLSLPAVFGNNMILQRGTPLRIFGKGSGSVTVRIGSTAKTTAAENGEWQIIFPPQEACSSTDIAVESGTELISFSNVAIGEVWLAGGQSNMELPVRHDEEWEQLIALANDSLLRYYEQPRQCYEGQELDEDFSQSGFWRSAVPEDMPYISAVGYHFASYLRSSLQVPVGIVGCNWGGTSAACWLSENALEECPELGVYLENYRQNLEKIDMESYAENFKDERKAMNSPSFQELFEKLHHGAYSAEELEEIQSQSPNFGEKPIGPMDPMRPCGLYETMLKKLVPFTFRGVIWYQGESDAGKHELYGALFTKMIENWRRDFQRKLPFLFVQLAPFGKWMGESGENYPQLRDAQQKVSETVANTWMASIMDCGEYHDIHPKRKRPVGERLAMLALANVYGKNIIAASPLPAKHCCADNTVKITFTGAGSGLIIQGGEINGLEVFDKNNEELQFNAKTQGNKLIISTDKTPGLIRFAKTAYTQVNLYNSAGLPAAPFEIQL